MFITVNKANWERNADGCLVPSSHGTPVSINIDMINTISDKYIYENTYHCVTILTTIGEEIECIDLFEDIEKSLKKKFAKFKVWSTVTDGDFIYVLINKKNVVSVSTNTFGTEIKTQDQFHRYVYVKESVDEVTERLTN